MLASSTFSHFLSLPYTSCQAQFTIPEKNESHPSAGLLAVRLEGMGKRLAKSFETGYDSSIIMVWEKYGAQTKAQEVSL